MKCFDFFHNLILILKTIIKQIHPILELVIFQYGNFRKNIVQFQKNQNAHKMQNSQPSISRNSANDLTFSIHGGTVCVCVLCRSYDNHFSFFYLVLFVCFFIDQKEIGVNIYLIPYWTMVPKKDQKNDLLVKNSFLKNINQIDVTCVWWFL